MLEVVQVLMTRDGLSEADALTRVRDCKATLEEYMENDWGYCPEDVIMDELGLEPDYLFEVLGV